VKRANGGGCGVWDAPLPPAFRSAGTTLVELMVVLVLLGLVVGLSGLTLGSLRPAAEAEGVQDLRRARAEAIRTGRPVRILEASGDTAASHTPHPTPFVTFLPDGRAFGPGLDPLTGALRDSFP